MFESVKSVGTYWTCITVISAGGELQINCEDKKCVQLPWRGEKCTSQRKGECKGVGKGMDVLLRGG